MFRSPPREIPSPKHPTVSPAVVPAILVIADGWMRCDRPFFAVTGWSQGWAAEQKAGAS